MSATRTSWLKGMFKPAPSRISRLTYAVGDIHGRWDLFDKIIQHIRIDSEAASERPLVVLLGDYVDRGPQSREVLDGILNLIDEDWCDLELLIGNHEEAMLTFLREPLSGSSWTDYGGGTTLGSYGVSMPYLRSDKEAWKKTNRDFASALPASHMNLMERMKLYLLVDDYLFVHAGVLPNVRLQDQGPETFLWIRGPFLRVEKSCEYVVVHGHTPESKPTNKRWRIGLDTGAYATGVLTGIRLQGEKRSLFDVRA